MPMPEPTPYTPAAPAGQPTDAARRAAALDFLTEIEDIMCGNAPQVAAEQTPRIPTSYKDPAPTPVIGDAPPVQQPGRPAMSQKATDDSVRMLSFGVTTVLASSGAYLVMKGSEVADPTVIGLICAAPIGLAVPVLAIGHMLRRANETVAAAPPQITQNITGPVHQDHSQTTNQIKGVIVHGTDIDQRR